MKKNPLIQREPEKPRRLVLSRETIQNLEKAEILATARGGGDLPTTSWPFTLCD